MTKLTIFIQCHNRPAYARYAIESALRQTNPDFRLVISDNSSNDEMCRLVQAEFAGLDYRRRTPMLPALDHFNTSISEADTDFLCLFHDDDLMEPGYVDAMMNDPRLKARVSDYGSSRYLRRPEVGISQSQNQLQCS